MIEHVENKNKLVTDIFQNCNSDVVISLPNTQHYRYVKGLVRGDMGKQFVFNVEDGVDRHKWVTFYKDNIQWLQHKAMENNFELIDYEDINLLTSKKQLLFLFSRNRKNYFVFNQVFHFRRTSI